MLRYQDTVVMGHMTQTRFYVFILADVERNIVTWRLLGNGSFLTIKVLPGLQSSDRFFPMLQHVDTW